MDKRLGHIYICGAFFTSHLPNPFPHTKNKVGRLYPVSGGQGGGERELPDIFKKVALIYKHLFFLIISGGEKIRNASGQQGAANKV